MKVAYILLLETESTKKIAPPQSDLPFTNTRLVILTELALIVNIVALAYIIIHSVKTKTNPYKGEAFTEFKYYKDAKARADVK